MITLVFANQKGGVGKSAIATQLAYYLADQLKKRVLFIDMDHQKNASKAIAKSGMAMVSKVTSSMIMASATPGVEDGDFVLVAADEVELLNMERQAAEHNRFASNFRSFIQAVDNHFDVCIVDTNPNPDIRVLTALISANFVVSPIQLNQEAIDGIGGLMNHERVGLRKIKAKLNPKLQFIGILPNLLEPTPFQKANFEAVAEHFGKLLIPMGSGYAAIKRSTAVAEAQAAGLPIWKIGKTSARETWAQMRQVFEYMTKKMGVV